ncbi:MAG: DUF177 domain-containing protein [Bacteroidales bacterium]|nr:DUF177 domain-containing protein [Bacteroidales bacterium]
MYYRRQFHISFSGLKLGNHRFEFEIDKKFFDEFGYSEYEDGLLNIVVEMEKQQRMLIFTFTILGTIDVVCDRCLDVFPLEIYGNYRLFVKFGNDSHEESDEVIVIPESETHFDIGHYIYEYIVLSVPMRHIHPDNEDGTSNCDPEILQKLAEHKTKEQIDPRWGILKKLKE